MVLVSKTGVKLHSLTCLLKKLQSILKVIYQQNSLNFLKVEVIEICFKKGFFYSHSIVAGGLELMSYTTRFTPLTLLMISLETLARNS